MIRTFLWAIATLGLILLAQTTLVSYVVIAGAKPNLLWVAFVVLATTNGSFVSQIVGFVLGLVVDMVSGAPLGYNAFLFSLAGYIFGLGSGKVYFDPLVMPATLGVVASLFLALGGFLLDTVFHLGTPWSEHFNLGLLLNCLFAMILSPLVFWIYGWIRERFQNPRRGFGG